MSCVYFHGLGARTLIGLFISSLQLIPWLLKSIQTDFSACFDEVCSRCSGGRVGTEDREDLRVDGFPLCEVPPLGAVAPFRGTTLATLTLVEGYYRTSNESHNILRCYHAAACHGGSDVNRYCNSGYMGPCEKSLATGNWFLGYALGMPALNRPVVVEPRHTWINITQDPYRSRCQDALRFCPELIAFPVSMVSFHNIRAACFFHGFTIQLTTKRFFLVASLQPALQTVRFVRKGMRQGLPTAAVIALGVSRYRRWRLWRRSLSPCYFSPLLSLYISEVWWWRRMWRWFKAHGSTSARLAERP